MRKYAIVWTRQSCCRFGAIALQLQLHAVVYKLGSFILTLTLADAALSWPTATLRQRLVKIDARIGLVRPLGDVADG